MAKKTRYPKVTKGEKISFVEIQLAAKTRYGSASVWRIEDKGESIRVTAPCGSGVRFDSMAELRKLAQAILDNTK